MISNELLSEVLGCDCSECYFEDTYNLIHYKYEYDVTWSEYVRVDNSEINIYELTHKCKAWALTAGFSITSTNSWMGDNTPCAQAVSNNGCEYQWIEADTEPEAVFKACQWVLENR